MNKISNALWGIVFIAIGLILGANALGFTTIHLFFKGWWTLFIIVPSFINLFKRGDKTGNIIFLLIGIALLLVAQGIVSFDMIRKAIIPTVLILLGCSFLFKGTINSKIKKEMKNISRNTEKEYYATFSSQNIDFSNEIFDGGEVNAIFGALKCDLSNANFTQDCILEVSSIFGGATIFVPKNIKVKISSTSIFGGVEDKRYQKTTDGNVTLYININCMFGGVDIK